MKRLALVPVLVVGLPFGGCQTGSTVSSVSSVEIIHWWTARGEKQAIDALTNLFQEKHPNENVVSEGLEGSSAARTTVERRLIMGQPPNSFQANGGWDLLSWVLDDELKADTSKMEPLDDIAAREGWQSVIPDSVLSTVRHDGHIYGVPLDIHRVNTLFFNQNVFANNDVPVPTTLDELFAAAAAFQHDHRIAWPIALGTRDGTLPLLFFENLLVARAGGDFYNAFMRGAGDPYAPEIAAAVDDLATLLTYVNPGSANLTWSQAADRVLAGDAAMTIMGDWAKAYMVSRQDSTTTPPTPTPVDFGAIPTPGTAGTFVFTTDTFGLPKGVPNRSGTIELLTFFGSKLGQDTFNPTKGSISPRTDTDTNAYDEMAKRTIVDFREASEGSRLFPATAILAWPDFITDVESILRGFMQDGNKSKVVHGIANNYDILMRKSLP